MRAGPIRNMAFFYVFSKPIAAAVAAISWIIRHT